MFTIYNLLVLIHLLGLALGVGSATVKLVLLLRCRKHHEFFHVYFRVSKLITRLLVTGIIMMTVSGITWLFIGYPVKMLLMVKLVFVGLIWVLGPVIDNVVEPKLEKSMPVQGQAFSPVFVRIHKQHLAFEITATLLMYMITILGVLL